MDSIAAQARNSERIKTLLPEIQPLIKTLLGLLEQEFDETPLITDANRTLEEQKKLYAQGRTTPGPQVTWTLDSKHIGGRAVDIAFLDANGKLTYSVNWEKFGSIVRSIPGLEWGFDLWKVDRPHVQFNPDKTVQHFAQPTLEWFLAEGLLIKEKDLEASPKWGEILQVIKNYHDKYGKKN